VKNEASGKSTDRSEQFATVLRLAVIVQSGVEFPRACDLIPTNARSYAGIFSNFWLSSGMGVQCSLLSQ
jgi:hypothetical protein